MGIYTVDPEYYHSDFLKVVFLFRLIEPGKYMHRYKQPHPSVKATLEAFASAQMLLPNQRNI